MLYISFPVSWTGIPAAAKSLGGFRGVQHTPGNTMWKGIVMTEVVIISYMDVDVVLNMLTGCAVREW